MTGKKTKAALDTAIGVTILLLVGLLAVGVIAGIVMWINKSGCDQRNVSRPDIRMEWHWNTGCMYVGPSSTTVVISR